MSFWLVVDVFPAFGQVRPCPHVHSSEFSCLEPLEHTQNMISGQYNHWRLRPTQVAYNCSQNINRFPERDEIAEH